VTEKLTPGAAKALVWPGRLLDDTVTGLELVANQNGTKTFRLFYRTKTRIARRPSLGRFPTMTIDGARRSARAILELVAQGRDPGAELIEKREGATVDELCDDYLRKWADVRKKPGPAAADRGMIENYVKPRLGRTKINDVTQRAIEDLLDDVLHRRIKTRHADRHKGATAPYAANRVRALLHTMFELAMLESWALRKPSLGNPAGKTTRQPEYKRKRIASEQELQKIAIAMGLLETHYPQQIAALRTIFFTGARKQEIAEVKASARRDGAGIFQGDRLVIEDHKMDRRDGAKTIHLPEQVTNILDTVPVYDPDGPLFGKHNLNWVWGKVRTAAGCSDLTIHDVRRTYLSIGLDLGMSLDKLGKLVGHASQQTTHGYAWMLEERRKAETQMIADQVQRLMEGVKA
jgi:site-specific recombinase XerD